MDSPTRRRAPPHIESLLAAVGNTPLVHLRRIGAGLPGIRLYAKAEFMNPGGSVKDRAALRMIEVALADGSFDPKRTRWSSRIRWRVLTEPSTESAS